MARVTTRAEVSLSKAAKTNSVVHSRSVFSWFDVKDHVKKSIDDNRMKVGYTCRRQVYWLLGHTSAL